ncbi:localization factor PodJL [Rhodoplanes tepidamans]|uniref:Localization factor PodJL n=2 Tax=Rhodoplanes TaxID=29407 RepID=A0ABT5J5H3_RHOTP|nr:hypothetical protein [Rhodoplanes tepidamans]MDC7784887.1 hypothetical protein [Rhodoplanes tepidamans]MDQ0353884.1 localization factor PodJL [Rhodoplanes tepidamans]
MPDRDLVALCNRFEGITRQLERLVHTTLDTADGKAAAPAAAQDSPLDRVVAEIAARQRALDGEGPAAVPSMFAPVMDPAALAPAAPDLSRLEEQLRLITAQIETLRSPCRAEEIASELREELRRIGRAIHDLVPRHAFEALEGEVRALAGRLDESRGSGFDPAVLAPLDQGLAEVREALRGLAPGELAGSVNTLFRKIDQVSVEGFDATVLHQLRDAVDTLRGIVSTVASGDALAALVAEVRTLSQKIEQAPAAPQPVSGSPQHDLLASLERQISGIAETLAAQNAAKAAAPAEPGDGAPAAAVSPTLEPLMASLAERLEKFDLLADERPSLAPIEDKISRLDDKLDRIGAGTLDAAMVAQVEDRIRMLADKLDRIERSALDHPGLAPLEQRIADLVRKIEQSESRLDMLPALERGMADLLAHVEALQAQRAATAEPSPAFAALARDVETIRRSQEDADRRTRESLEAAHGTLGRMADRLAAIETDLRGTARRPSPAEMPATFEPSPAAPAAAAAAAAPAAAPGPRLNGFAIPIGPPPRPAEPAAPPAVSGALAPDAPIEPGSGPPWQRGSRSAADRIAASQAALGAAAEAPAGSGAKPNFILAARRAAQAASEQPGPQAAAGAGDAADGSRGRRLTDRVKALFMTTSVIVIALALVPIGLKSFGPWGGDGAAPIAVVETPEPTAGASVADKAAPGHAGAQLTELVPPSDLAAAARKLSNASPTAKALIEKHLPKLKDETSLLAPPAPAATPPAPSPAARPSAPPVVAAPATVPAAPSAAPTRTATVPPATPAPEVTGTVPVARLVPPPATPLPAPLMATPSAPAASSAAAPGAGESWPETLPAALATRPLIAGVAARNPAAAYEIAMRYAEGRGVPADLAAALPWFQRAADAGLAPAQFRLGSLYEKGNGVKKDLVEARRWYLAAAERGNANAMHNIAVLYAEGIDGKPDFATAVQWFTRAARHGVADSQYNLAVLHARGIGTEQNLAEAYKWFAIAAQKGDKDAARKRDDLARQLDQQSLTAARLAAQSFVPLAPPEEAVTVPPPPGGWEDAASGQGRPKPKSRIPLEQAARL